MRQELCGLRTRYSRLSLEVADTGPVPVLLLLFGVEEVVSNALEEGLSFGYRFKSVNDSFLGFWLRGV